MPGQSADVVLADVDATSRPGPQQPGGVHGGRRRPRAGLRQLRVLQLPRSLQINGPAQVQNQLESDDAVAEQINILKRGDSEVELRQPADPARRRRPAVRRAGLRAGRGHRRRSRCCARCWCRYGNNVAFEDTLQRGAGHGVRPAGRERAGGRRRDDHAAAVGWRRDGRQPGADPRAAGRPERDRRRPRRP